MFVGQFFQLRLVKPQRNVRYLRQHRQGRLRRAIEQAVETGEQRAAFLLQPDGHILHL
mgnify:CR=1 FL=1